MRLPITAAALAAALPAAGMAQGWEMRAGLETASASVCSEAGTCFGISCKAADQWNPVWIAEFQPAAGAAASDPILAIRMDGARFALTSLASNGSAGGYTAPIAAEDAPLLAALQRGDFLSVDPGRDFSMSELSLRGSSWAIGQVLALCNSGGPESNLPSEDAAPAG